MLRPIEVGDFVTTAGITGTVEDVVSFVTISATIDDVSTVAGNDQPSSDNVMSHPTDSHRRV
jgi:small conductance mechanosensitive channel